MTNLQLEAEKNEEMKALTKDQLKPKFDRKRPPVKRDTDVEELSISTIGYSKTIAQAPDVTDAIVPITLEVKK